MLDTLMPRVEQLGINLYEIAVMTDEGLEYRRTQPSNLCQDSYSVAKAFTMTAAGLLWDRGLLDVDEPVCPILKRFLPEGMDEKWARVTVHHALTHTIGFDQGFLDIDVEDASVYGDYLTRVLTHPIAHEPGTMYRYSDAAFYLVSRVIAERAGQTCDALLSDLLYRVFGAREVAWSRDPEGYPIGATGLYVTARDMVKLGWLYACGGVYAGERVLSEKWVDLVRARGYELSPMGGDLIGKGGMYGQMVLYSEKRRFAAAWHAFAPRGTGALIDLFREV